MIDPQFRHPLPHWPHIARMTKREAVDTNQDTGTSLAVPEPPEPSRKLVSLPNFDHSVIVLYKGHSVNHPPP